jgi:DNA-binding YbaB/EbfC family protein
MAKGGFRGGYGGGSQMSMMKQAQKMQQDFLKMQQELEASTFEFSSGGGAVKAVVAGTRQFQSIEIDPEAVDPEDVEMLQDLVLAAVNGALKLCDDRTSEAMNKLQGGMGGFPGLF